MEETKSTATDIAEKVTQANDTSMKLSKAREVYRPVAARGALVYFLVDALSALDRVYHYTMATFVSIMVKGAQRVLSHPIELFDSLYILFLGGIRVYQRHNVHKHIITPY